MEQSARNGERRRYTRYQVPDETYAFINHMPFVIRNISKGGLRLQSVIFDDIPAQDVTLDIFCKQDNFYLQDIPVRLVTFQKDLSKNAFSSIQIKFFGLQFGELTEQQLTRLDYFISRNISGEA